MKGHQHNPSNTDDDYVEISIIIPAYKEKDNLKPLVERLCQAMGPKMTSASEIIVVDDNSGDGSKEVCLLFYILIVSKPEQVIEKLSESYPVRIIVRTTERGLSSAVLRGFEESRGILCLKSKKLN